MNAAEFNAHEVVRLRAEVDQLTRERDEARAEVVRHRRIADTLDVRVDHLRLAHIDAVNEANENAALRAEVERLTRELIDLQALEMNHEGAIVRVMAEVERLKVAIRAALAHEDTLSGEVEALLQAALRREEAV
jgi:hypothetical protein